MDRDTGYRKSRSMACVCSQKALWRSFRKYLHTSFKRPFIAISDRPSGLMHKLEVAFKSLTSIPPIATILMQVVVHYRILNPFVKFILYFETCGLSQ